MNRLLLMLIVASFMYAQHTRHGEDVVSSHHKTNAKQGELRPIHITDVLNSSLVKLGLTPKTKKKKGTAPSDTLGTVRNFFVNNSVTGIFDQVEFRLTSIGSVSQVWSSTSELSNGNLTQAVSDTVLLYMENKSGVNSVDPQKGVIQIDNEYFGNPPDYDGDGKVDVLLVDVKDGWSPSSGGGYVAGFFYGIDQFTDAQAQASGLRSNERDIVYIDSYPGIFNGATVNPLRPLGTLAHEYQHLIHYNYDRNEFTFVNEGLSEVAEYVTGLGTRSANLYLSDLNVPIFRWDRDNSLPEYSRTSLFYNYIADRFGMENLKYHTQSPLTGAAGFDASLDSIDQDFDFADILHDFHITNAINNSTLGEDFYYKNPARSNLSIPEQSTVREVNGAEDNSSFSVDQGAVGYLTFKNITQQDAVFTFPIDFKVTAITFDGSAYTSYPLSSGSKLDLSGSNLDFVTYVMTNTSLPAGGSSTINTSEVSWDITGAVSLLNIVEKTYSDTPEFFWSVPYENTSGVLRGGFANQYTISESAKLNSMRLFLVSGTDTDGNTIGVIGEGYLVYSILTDSNGVPNEVMKSDSISFDDLRTKGTGWIDFDVSHWDLNLIKDQKVHAVYRVNVPVLDRDSNSVPLRLDDGAGEQGVSRIVTGKNSYATMFTSPTTSGEHNVWNELSLQLQNEGPYTVDFAIMQNPSFPSNAWFFIKANKASKNLSGVYTQSGDTMDLEFEIFDAANNIFVDRSIRLDDSSSVSINFSIEDNFFGLTKDTSFYVNSVIVSSEAKTITAGQAEVTFSEQTFLNKEKILVSNLPSRFKSIEANINSKKLIEALRIGQESTKIFREVEVFVNTNNYSDVEVFQYSNGCTEKVSYREVENGILFVTKQLGYFEVFGDKSKTLGPSDLTPSSIVLDQNYPNPFNPKTTIRFSLSNPEFISLRIFNSLGIHVKTLVNDHVSSGVIRVEWDGTNNQNQKVASGVYFYQLVTRTKSITRKMMLLK